MHKSILTILFIIALNSGMAQLPSKPDTIINTTIEPYNKICYMHIFRKRLFKKDRWFQSTGFFIAPNVILTAAHNIYSPWIDKVTYIKIFPGRYLENYPFDSIEINGKKACRLSIKTDKRYAFSKSIKKRQPYDFSLIIIPKTNLKNDFLTNRNVFILDSTFELQSPDTIHVAGYPANPEDGFNGDLMISQTDTCTRIEQKIFRHALKTSKGNSGSPIWVEKNSNRIIVGVHTFSGSATKMNAENINTIIKWIGQNQ